MRDSRSAENWLHWTLYMFHSIIHALCGLYEYKYSNHPEEMTGSPEGRATSLVNHAVPYFVFLFIQSTTTFIILSSEFCNSKLIHTYA